MDGWNVTAEGGVIVGYLCSTCQTPKENAEAEINQATLVYGRDPDGLIVSIPKTAADDA